MVAQKVQGEFHVREIKLGQKPALMHRLMVEIVDDIKHVSRHAKLEQAHLMPRTLV